MDYTSFFLNSSGGVVQLECIEISHPSFTKTFRYVRNDEDGVKIGKDVYQYQPMSIKRANVTNDLEQRLSITLADMEDEFSDAIDNILLSTSSRVKPKLVFKMYRDDDLSAPMNEIQTLEIATISGDSTGLVTFEAQAPELNAIKTGRLFTFEDYPLLRGI
ncbi:hypothetical protein B9T31_12075 [Acinetobacter sp. ANC 4558]|uniref:DUF1833 family protein n=1 Tax=Acinetobacter sp. ANC 4558 TaxID=1977876 RepID=UPI000A3324D5|nr:DUF1833 family protein [Acinetobacter sp. ANC 4558]OTG85521.1 hypothetical protein B9T31_12075 [Acinetobacter sp. ANC 4558]